MVETVLVGGSSEGRLPGRPCSCGGCVCRSEPRQPPELQQQQPSQGHAHCRMLSTRHGMFSLLGFVLLISLISFSVEWPTIRLPSAITSTTTTTTRTRMSTTAAVDDNDSDKQTSSEQPRPRTESLLSSWFSSSTTSSSTTTEKPPPQGSTGTSSTTEEPQHEDIFAHARLHWNWTSSSSTTSTDKAPLAPPIQQQQQEDPATVLADCDNSTTLLISSSLVPTSPAIDMVWTTYLSCRKHLLGLCPDSPVVVTIDGIRKSVLKEQGEEYTKNRFHQYVHNIKRAFSEPQHAVVVSSKNRNIAGNAEFGMRRVTTPFVYYIQHDLMFVRDIQHGALIQMMKQHPQELKIVRFNEAPWLKQRGRELNYSCYNQSTILNDNSYGLSFVKTPIWSDRIHLTTTQYYQDMFRFFRDSLNGKLPWAMENIMDILSHDDCERYGPYYYGPYGSRQTIQHLHGRTVNTSSELALPPLDSGGVEKLQGKRKREQKW